MKSNKAREQLIEAFKSSLIENRIPWEQGWKSDRPVNAVSNTRYRGINWAVLYLKGYENGYSDPRWCTYNQAQKKGWQIKRGEKGTPVEFWSMYDTETKKKISSSEAEKLRETLGDKFKDRIKPISSVSYVFNAAQIDGIPEYEFKREPIDEKILLQHRDKLIDSMDLIFHEGGSRAFYSPLEDSITMPEVSDFKDTYSYMATFLHEAGHATGHELRMNRNIKNTFGTPDYAREELRAEISSAFTAQAIGLEHSEEPEYLNNHKAYIQSWIDTLQKNPNELFKAINEAEKISDYLIEKGEFEQIKTQELQQKQSKEISEQHIMEKDIMHKKIEMPMNPWIPAQQQNAASITVEEKNKITDIDLEKNTIVINAFAGPSAGKTTSAHLLVAELKKRGYVVEFVSEVAKEMVWDEKFELLDGSIESETVIYQEKKHRIDRLMNKVDFIVTDSPTIQSVCFLNNNIVSAEAKEEFAKIALEDWKSYNTFNYFVERDVTQYEGEGRIHTLDEAIRIDNDIKEFLTENNIYFGIYNHNTIDKIVNNSIATLNRINSKIQGNLEKTPNYLNEKQDDIQNQDMNIVQIDSCEELDKNTLYKLSNYNSHVKFSVQYVTIEKCDKDSITFIESGYEHEDGARDYYDKKVTWTREKINKDLVSLYREGRMSRRDIKELTQSIAEFKEAHNENSINAIDTNLLPDPTVSIEDMNIYGYTWEGMVPLSRERAIELQEYFQIFRLYEDASEGMVEGLVEEDSHNGLYGITKEDWEADKDKLKELDKEVNIEITNKIQNIGELETSLNVPEQERITQWFGDYSMYEAKIGVTREQINTRLDKLLNLHSTPDILNENNTEFVRVDKTPSLSFPEGIDKKGYDKNIKNQFFKMVENAEKNRLQLIFDGKPNEEVRDFLKEKGFRWFPEDKAWQRPLTDNAKDAAKDVMDKLRKMGEENKKIIENSFGNQNKNTNTYKKSFEQRTYDYKELEKQLRLHQNKQIKELLAKEKGSLDKESIARLEKSPQLENSDNGYSMQMEGVELEIEIEAQ